MAGRIINSRYELGELIGSGQMADVYQATDNLLGRKVALKVLHQQYADDPAYMELFRKDAQAATNINNPNVIDVYDWGVEEGTCYVVVEYVEEINLKDIILRVGRLTQKRAVGIAMALCSALEAAHTAGIMHCDLRSQNIVVTDDNQVKVMGFGIARPPNESRSDLYSLGMVLYEMLTGRKPTEERGAVAKADRRVGVGPPPPSTLNPEISPALDTIVAKALSGNPESRYHSIRAMHADLQRYLEIPQRADVKRVRHEGRLADFAGASRDVVSRTVGRTADVFRPRPWLWISLLLLILAGIGVVIWASVKGPSGIAVPKITGKTRDEAVEALRKAQLKPGNISTETSTSVPAGMIISQKPEPGTKVQKDTKVAFAISGGQKLVEVPDCRGLSQPDAATKLSQSKLMVGSITQDFSTDVPSGKVSAQSPEAGSQAPPNTSVDLVVSKGAQMVLVPRVLGLSKDAATTQLKNKGLNAEVQEVQSTTQTQGIVFEQNPQAGQSVSTGTTVVISVAVKPKLVSVPSVVGLTLDAARTKIIDAKLSAGLNGSPAPTDRVVAQEPAASTMVNENSEVKLFFR